MREGWQRELGWACAERVVLGEYQERLEAQMDSLPDSSHTLLCLLPTMEHNRLYAYTRTVGELIGNRVKCTHIRIGANEQHATRPILCSCSVCHLRAH